MNWTGPKGFDEANYYRDEKNDSNNAKSDIRIKEKSEEALSRNSLLKGHRIKVRVEKGIVTLKGGLKEQSLRKEAENSIRQLSGVKGVLNLIG